MEIINQITNSIIKNTKDGETIRRLAEKTGFAYSAVYKWVMILKDYEVISLIEKGNKSIIKINKNEIYRKFLELDNAVDIVEKDKVFWNIVKKIKIKIRFTKSTGVVIWTMGGYITGDFLDKIYFLEVYHKDLISFKKVLEKHNIAYSENEIINKRPLILIKANKRNCRIYPKTYRRILRRQIRLKAISQSKTHRSNNINHKHNHKNRHFKRTT